MTALAYALTFDEDEEQTEFTFDQLDDRAKERARDWFREDYPDTGWWDSVYEDADKIADMLGVTIGDRPVRLMSGATRRELAIWFSGFCSQGDGACFEGGWSPVTEPIAILDQVLDYAPQDEGLHEIAFLFADLSERCAIIPDAWARVRHSGHYYHSGCTEIEFDLPTPDNVDEDNELQLMVWNALCTKARLDYSTFEADIKDALRSFMDWIYLQLESEYEWLTSDENVDESIIANGYTFDEDGSRI